MAVRTFSRIARTAMIHPSCVGISYNPTGQVKIHPFYQESFKWAQKGRFMRKRLNIKNRPFLKNQPYWMKLLQTDDFSENHP